MAPAKPSLSTLYFLKIPENISEVFKILENSLEVLKVLENNLESMKLQENIHLKNSSGLKRPFQLLKIILSGIDNDIYFTVDACPNACEMWKAIERFYKMMNELVRNQCDVTNHQVNVQFLLQLQPEWQRFVTLVKQSQELKTVSYHKLYDILKQHQNEVNEIRAERLARTANPLALVAQQQPVYHPQNHPTHYTHNSSTKSQQAATRNRGKAIVNSSTPTYDQEPTMVAEDDEMSKDKEIDKLMALISLSFKKIYKPTNNNLRTSSNTSRANQDNTPRINRGTGYDNQRVVNVVGARENVGTPVVQQSGIQCYNCKEYGHVARECQKPKRAKDAAYHKEKMLLCKQEEAGFQLNAEQADWRDDTDDEPEDQELEAHYMYMAQIQEVTPDAADNSGPIFDAEPLQKLVEIILFIVDSGCSKHMTRNFKLLRKITIKRVYYVKGLNHNLFSVGQFCDADLEVAFRKSTCYISDLKGNDLLTGSYGTDLYSITLQDTSTPNTICLMAKATSSQAWLWHRRLSHLNLDTINLLSKNDIVTGLPKLKFVKDHLCSSYELGKAKRKSFHTKTTPSSKRRLQLLHMDLCGPMRVESINVLIDFLTLVQRGLHAQVRIVRTDKGTTTSAPRLPNPDKEVAKLSALRRSTVIHLRLPEITDEVYELKRREKGKNVEEFRNSPILTPIRSPRILFNLVSSDTEKLQELTDTPHATSSSGSPHKKLTKTNHLLSLFKTKPTLFKCYKSFFHELQGRYGYLFGHLRARFMPRKSFDTLADNLHDVMVESLPNIVDKHVKKQVMQQVTKQVRNQVLVYVAEGLILERKKAKEEKKRLIAKAILQERRNIQAQILTQIENAIANVIPSQVDASMKFERNTLLQTTYRTPAVRPRDQDDPYDDAYPEGESSAKRQKTLKYEAYVSGESSFGQVFQEEQAPSTSGNQGQDNDFDFWTDSYATDNDEIPTKQVSQDIMEEVSLIIDEAKMRKMADEMLRQRCTSGDEHQYHIDHIKNFLKKIVARRANDCIVLITEPDYKNLNKNNIEDIYLLIVNGKVPDYADTRLLWSLSVFIRSSVIWERVHDFQLRIESYQHKVNLTAPTITFPGIKEHDMFSIIYEPMHEIIYKNRKKEKRVTRHIEIHKFYDATLNRVLEGLKSYNNDVKYGYVLKDLTKDETEYLKLFEEDIKKRLKHQRQMRRWEMYVNGRPFGLRSERPE
ncbi:retrovirus-related pol polyprotein from transposon TNT 1-94 [Tanacetum coccineum]|uniref:Retrovirus-related pol polyprotein from transposon TNT 1-94 n=1 Tax=Tanacetum coccineum TaxID=301880 RepID=A0ABQ5HLS1_9ASTR